MQSRAWFFITSIVLLAGCGDNSAPSNTADIVRDFGIPAQGTAELDQRHEVGQTQRTFRVSGVSHESSRSSAPSRSVSPGSIELVDPGVSLNPIEIGDPLDVDDEPWDTTTEAIELGEPLDADLRPNGGIEEMDTVASVELGEPLDADESSADGEEPASYTDLGDWRDADAPDTDPMPATQPVDLGPPLLVPGTPPIE